LPSCAAGRVADARRSDAQMSCLLPPNAARHALAQQQDDNNDDKYQTETAAHIHIEPP